MTTFLSVLIIALPVVASVAPFFMPERKESPIMHRRWRIGFVVFAIFYSGLVWFWQYRTTKEDEIKRKDALIQNSSDVRKIVKEEDQGVVANLNRTIGTLSDLVSSQQKQISDIHNSNIVTGKKPVQVEVANYKSMASGDNQEQKLDVRVSSLPITSDPQLGKHGLQFILTTNKTMNGGRVRVTCANTIRQATAEISGAGFELTGGGGLLDANTYESGIGSPNWAPGFPLVITIYYDEADLGTCSFRPL